MAGRRRNIQEYQKLLHEYSKRREFYLSEYGSKDARYLNCRKKIHNCNRAINRFHKRKKEIKKIALRIKEFIGVDVRDKLKRSWQTKEQKAARGIFFKYGMQSGIIGRELAEYLGLKCTVGYPSTYRMKFTRSFKTNKYNKEMYHRFLKFIKEKR